MIEKFDIGKVKAHDKMNITLSVRISRERFEWLKKNHVSATKLFNYFLEQAIKK